MVIIPSPEFLRKHPWLGVLIGTAGAALAAVLAGIFWIEYSRYAGAGAPQEVTVEEAALAHESDKK